MSASNLSMKRLTRAQLLDPALAYASIGLGPVPMISVAKRPALRGWRDLVSCDPDSVRAAFKAAPRADGVAIATGNGVLVLDLDRNHGDGGNGIVSLGALAHAHDDALPSGPRARTPSGGVHLYLRYDADIRVPNRVSLAPGIDVRGDGGLALAPPSVGRAGAYRWSPGPFDRALPAAPRWLLDLIRPPEPPRTLRLPRFCASIPAYARAALLGEVEAVSRAAPGTRNQTLFKAAASLGSLAVTGALQVEEITTALTGAAGACALLRDDGARAVAATITSGLRHGAARPRQLPSRSRHAAQ